MVEIKQGRTYLVFSVPGYKDIRMPLNRYLDLVAESNDCRHLQTLILQANGITKWKTPTTRMKKAAAVASL